DSNQQQQQQHNNDQSVVGRVESSRSCHWKDELKDIQAARVEREVAKLQRTINETQRRWEESYARHSRPSAAGGCVLSDGPPTDFLHNTRADGCRALTQRDLWRTVSVDTLPVTSSKSHSRLHPHTSLRPLSRHTSADNLRHPLKLSNDLQQHLAGSYGSLLQHLAGINTRSGVGEEDSDGGLTGHTPLQDVPPPALPSVRKLASKFDPFRVNDLDKNVRNSMVFGDVARSRSSFTNNLDKLTEKAYVAKETHSHSDDSDDESSIFDGSVSLPPTPGSLQQSLSVSSLVDTDSCYSYDPHDQTNTTTDRRNDKTIFGVSLRRAGHSSPVHIYPRKRDSGSLDDGHQRPSRSNRRHVISSAGSLEVLPSDGSQHDAPKTLRQSTIIKVRHHSSHAYASLPPLSPRHSSNMKKYHSSHDLSSAHQTGNTHTTSASVNTTKHLPPNSKGQKSGPNISIVGGPAFIPKRRMSDFIGAYRGQKSIAPCMKRIEGRQDKVSSGQGALLPSPQAQDKPFVDSQVVQERVPYGNLRSEESSVVRVDTNSKLPKEAKQSVQNGNKGPVRVSELTTTVNNNSLEYGKEVKDEVAKTVIVTVESVPNYVKDTVTQTDVTDGRSSDDEGSSSSSNSEESESAQSPEITTTIKPTVTPNLVNDPFHVKLNTEVVSAFKTKMTEEHPSSDSGTEIPRAKPSPVEVQEDVVKRRDAVPSLSKHKSISHLLKDYSRINSLEEKKPPVQVVKVSDSDYSDSEIPSAKTVDTEEQAEVKSGVPIKKKRKSIGDLLKEYSNISSLDEKKLPVPVKMESEAELNKTVIAVNKPQPPPKEHIKPNISSASTTKGRVMTRRLSQGTAATHNNRTSTTTTPETRVKSLTHSYIAPSNSVGKKEASPVNKVTHSEVFTKSLSHNYITQDNTTTTRAQKMKASSQNGEVMVKNLSHTYISHDGQNVENDAVKSTTTIITVSSKPHQPQSKVDDATFHASTIYIADGSGEEGKYATQINVGSTVSSPTRHDANVTVTNINSHDPTQEKAVMSSRRDPIQEKEEFIATHGKITYEQSTDEPQGPHVTVVTVTDGKGNKSKCSSQSSSDDSTNDGVSNTDHKTIKEIILQESRTGKHTNKNITTKRANLTKASIPVNSPFSLLRNQTGNVQLSTTKTPIGPRDSYDEGVDLSDRDSSQSPLSANSGSSTDVGGQTHHNIRARVECDTNPSVHDPQGSGDLVRYIYSLLPNSHCGYLIKYLLSNS
ncbi:hypothetical protein Pcinc_039271, partial [Petrolisthes cinctipes]